MKKVKIVYQIQEWYPQQSAWLNYDAPNPDRKESIYNYNRTRSMNLDQKYQLIKIATTVVLPND